MSVSQLAKKHGLAVARVAGEEDPYVSLVQKMIGPPRLLKHVFAPDRVIDIDSRLQKVVTKALDSAGISYIKTGNHAAIEVNRLACVIGERVKSPPEFRSIMFGSSEMMLVANNGVDIGAALKRVFLSKRVRAAIKKSRINHLVNKEIELEIEFVHPNTL